MRIIYFALYQSIYQYGLLVWGGLAKNILNTLQMNQNNIVRICLNKCTLEGSTKNNYRVLGVLPIKYLYKKLAFMFVFKRNIKDISNSFFKNKRTNRVYDIRVKYAFKSCGQSFVDYLGPTYFNSMPFEFKQKIHCNHANVKNIIYKYLFLELE
jgi:hypothetical protein